MFRGKAIENLRDRERYFEAFRGIVRHSERFYDRDTFIEAVGRFLRDSEAVWGGTVRIK